MAEHLNDDGDDDQPLDESAVDIGEELEHAWVHNGVDDWPADDRDPAFEAAAIDAADAEDTMFEPGHSSKNPGA